MILNVLLEIKKKWSHNKVYPKLPLVISHYMFNNIYSVCLLYFFN